MKKLNNKGFTLVELLAVLVILVAIMSIAIPSISSSLERSKSKQDEARKKVLISAAELYITDNKGKLTTAAECKIPLKTLSDNNYVPEDALNNTDGKPFSGIIKYTKSTNKYEYTETNVINICIP